jgi:glycosyltransferase involved in cell wall biosynthesis
MIEDTDTAERPVICFLSRKAPARYKDLDAEILGRHFKVLRVDYSYTLESILQFRGAVKRCDVIVSWFANPWFGLLLPLVPKRVRIVVIAGGYDVADCPALDYGARRRPFWGMLTRRLLKRANLVLPVSKFNEAEMLTWVQPAQTRLVYNAVDFPEFSLVPNRSRQQKVVTVGAIESFISKRKGHFVFIDVARQLPEVEFVLIGKPMDDTIEYLKELAPSNVRFTGYVTRQEMIQEMLSASVYLQMSAHEAFGVSVAEAVACGCYPIVSVDTALPEVIGTCGRVLPVNPISDVVDAVSNALSQASYTLVDPVRIRQKFGVAQREQQLVAVIKELINENG